MRILQRDHILPKTLVNYEPKSTELYEAYFLNFTSATRSRPPFMLSARKTFPVVAIATMCECSLKGLKEIGS